MKDVENVAAGDLCPLPFSSNEPYTACLPHNDGNADWRFLTIRGLYLIVQELTHWYIPGVATTVPLVSGRIALRNLSPRTPLGNMYVLGASHGLLSVGNAKSPYVTPVGTISTTMCVQWPT